MMIALDHLLQKENWPLSLGSYDRHPLSNQELSHIQNMPQRQVRTRWFQDAQYKLQRLVTPIVDALSLFNAKPRYRNVLVAIFLESQFNSQQVFWYWPEARWRTLYEMMVQERQAGNLDWHLSLFLNTAYLLTGFAEFDRLNGFDSVRLAQLVFGIARFDQYIKVFTNALVDAGFNANWCQRCLPPVLAVLALKVYSLDPTAITLEILRTAHDAKSASVWHDAYVRIAFVLQQWGILSTGLEPNYIPLTTKAVIEQAREGIAADWLNWVDRWVQHSPLAPNTQKTHYRWLLQVGRWLAQEHPEIIMPEQWTRDLAVSFVAAVDRLKVGDWAQLQHKRKQGLPVSASTKSRLLSITITFFMDLQEWEWIPRRFDPQRCLAVPRSIQGQLGPQPRPIDSAIWKKLVIAALQLKAEDLSAEAGLHYPLDMVKAVSGVWVFSGLRPDEIRRLRLNCLSYSSVAPDLKQVCWLEVPANKQNPAYTKPVDKVIEKLISTWQHQRPPTPTRVDTKTGRQVDFLFDYAGQLISYHYLERTLIPLLCQVSGVPATDSYGPITPNRARHTIAYQLANGREPMPLLELQAWMGHKTPDSTLHYTSRSPLELSKAVEQYVTRNTRLAEVLIDRQAVETGATVNGAPWKYYDVGPGYCTNDFFETCPHRIACARCASYIPKQSATAQWQEAQTHLLRMRESIPLTDEMVAAIDGGLEAIQHLLTRLADIPTLSGTTPRDLGTTHEREPNLILLKDIL